jgi:hypothetical protein
MYPDENGAFPIHHLVRGRMCHFDWNSLVTHVIRLYPELIQNLDKNGSYPLHMAQVNVNNYEQLLKSLLMLYFGKIRMAIICYIVYVVNQILMQLLNFLIYILLQRKSRTYPEVFLYILFAAVSLSIELDQLLFSNY